MEKYQTYFHKKTDFLCFLLPQTAVKGNILPVLPLYGKMLSLTFSRIMQKFYLQ